MGTQPSSAPPPVSRTLAALLLITSGLSVLLTAIVGPSLPQMERHFAATPHVAYWVSLAVTAPMLAMVLTSIFVGLLSDRFGRKRMMVWACLGYAGFGLAPLLLDSLYTIVVSRLCIGVAEAVLMTCSMSLIGDYFTGERRERFMGLQMAVSAIAAVLLNLLGGYLGEFGWRLPYTVYAIGFLLMPFMHIYVWEPVPLGGALRQSDKADGPTFRPALLALICAATLVAAIAFMVVPVNMGFLFYTLGEQQARVIGMAYAVNSLGIVVGSFAFAYVVGPRLSVVAQLTGSTLLTGLGFVLIGNATSVTALTVAGAVNGVGCGLLFPALTAWNMRELPDSKRGFGTGASLSALYLGFFVSPLLIVGFSDAAGGRAAVIGATGVMLLVVAVLLVPALALVRRARRGGRATAHLS
jgi:MFS family permease